MTKTQTYAVAAVAWLLLTTVLWVVAVPESLSVVSLAWVSTILLAMFTVPITVQRIGRPSRSIAGILHDTERPPVVDDPTA